MTLNYDDIDNWGENGGKRSAFWKGVFAGLFFVAVLAAAGAAGYRYGTDRAEKDNSTPSTETVEGDQATTTT